MGWCSVFLALSGSVSRAVSRAVDGSGLRPQRGGRRFTRGKEIFSLVSVCRRNLLLPGGCDARESPTQLPDGTITAWASGGVAGVRGATESLGAAVPRRGGVTGASRARNWRARARNRRARAGTEGRCGANPAMGAVKNLRSPARTKVKPGRHRAKDGTFCCRPVMNHLGVGKPQHGVSAQG